MAQFVLGDQDIVRDISPRENDNCDNDNGDSETGQGGIEEDKRHYKKDSRYGRQKLLSLHVRIMPMHHFYKGIWKICIH